VILYLLRHAKSDWDDPDLEDHKRPLAPRGERDAKKMAKHLRRARIKPALVLCSSAKRARQTVELLASALGKGTETSYEDDLYGADEKDLLKRLNQVPDGVKSVMLVGHNPTMQQLALALAASGADLDRLRENLATCGLVTLTLNTDKWNTVRPGSASVIAYVTPKDIAG
jgi:phosphohistidine phosphatase